MPRKKSVKDILVMTNESSTKIHLLNLTLTPKLDRMEPSQLILFSSEVYLTPRIHSSQVEKRCIYSIKLNVIIKIQKEYYSHPL